MLRFGLRPICLAYAGEQRRLATLLNAAPEGVLEVDPDGKIIFVNRPLCALFGYAQEELLGRSMEDLVPARARARHTISRSEYFAGSMSRSMGDGLEVTGVRKDGTEIDLDVSLHRLETSRGIVTYGFVRDVSVRKAHEKQLVESNKQLLAGVATLERSARELQQLTEMGELLQSSATEAELFNIAAHTVERLFPVLSGSFYVLGDSRSTAEAASSWGASRDHLRPLISRDDCWALRRSRPHSGATEVAEPRCEHYFDGTKRPCQCIPLLGHGDLLGVLHLCTERFADAQELTSPAREQFIQALANQVASSTANLRLRETLRSQSLVDPLTGLYNRRAIDEWFERDIRSALRSQRPVSLLLMDVDHFKRFNDRFGHEGGDIALRSLGALLKRTLRSEDLVCRYGGEEFVALLPDASVDDATATAEKLRRTVEALVLHQGSRALGSLTVSVGVANLGAHGQCADQLLRHADRALYRAKAGGRNCVVVSDESDESGTFQLMTAAPRRA